jgi:hypothetical protein
MQHKGTVFFFRGPDALGVVAHGAASGIFLKWQHGFEISQNRCKAKGWRRGHSPCAHEVV